MGIYMIWERIKRIIKGKANDDSISSQLQERDKMIFFECKKCG